MSEREAMPSVLSVAHARTLLRRQVAANNRSYRLTAAQPTEQLKAGDVPVSQRLTGLRAAEPQKIPKLENYRDKSE